MVETRETNMANTLRNWLPPPTNTLCHRHVSRPLPSRCSGHLGEYPRACSPFRTFGFRDFADGPSLKATCKIGLLVCTRASENTLSKTKRRGQLRNPSFSCARLCAQDSLPNKPRGQKPGRYGQGQVTAQMPGRTPDATKEAATAATRA